MTHELATLVILAGGESRRMGFPKHTLLIDGVDVLTRLHRQLGQLFAETIVVGRDEAVDGSAVRCVRDAYGIRSPLVGIHAGLFASRTDRCLVVACDMPYVASSLAEHLVERSGEADVVVPIVRGYFEPLCAVYRRTCVEAIEGLIECGILKVSRLYDLVSVLRIEEETIREFDPELRSFENLNIPGQTPSGS